MPTPLGGCRHTEIAAPIALVCGFGVDFKERLSGVNQVWSKVKCVALFCLLLTLWSSLAFAAHHHSNGAESAKCTVCVVAHSAAPRTTSIPLKLTFVSVFTFRPEPILSAERFVAFALSVRPPPAV